METESEVRPGTGSGWAMITAGVLHGAFHAGAILITDDGDDSRWLGLLIHAILIVSLMIGLIGARHRLDLEGWAGTAWTISTVLAFLGVTVGQVFWSAAMIGIAAVTLLVFHQRIIATIITLGAFGWLYLYAIGVRVGDENGRLITPTETRTAVLALTLMSVGLVALGTNIVQHRHDQPSPV